MVTEGITADHLKEVYSDPYIIKVGHDGRAAEPVDHPLARYLSAWVGDKFAGAFLVIAFSPFEVELHAFLKKEYLKHSRELGKACIAFAFSHKSVLRVTAFIIEGLEMAKNYCLKLGFKHEGTRRNACMQDGKIKDVYVMGMTRAEWVML